MEPLDVDSSDRKRQKTPLIAYRWKQNIIKLLPVVSFILFGILAVYYHPNSTDGISDMANDDIRTNTVSVSSVDVPAIPPPTGERPIRLTLENQTATGGYDDDVTIQLHSDLHLEFYHDFEKTPMEKIIIPRAPILALLGDIGLACSPLLRKFLLYQADQFQYVLFVAGNHEFYNNNHHNNNGSPHSVYEQYKWMRQVCSERKNLFFLDRQLVQINQVTILPTTLWSYIPPETATLAESSMNDYKISFLPSKTNVKEKQRLVRMTSDFTSRWHTASLSWLQSQLEVCSYPVVVLTHHTPRMIGTSDPQYDGTPLSVCFSTDLRQLLNSSKIHSWACGHTHYNFDRYVPPEARLVSNQRGYPKRPKTDYRPDGILLRVELPIQDVEMKSGSSS